MVELLQIASLTLRGFHAIAACFRCVRRRCDFKRTRGMKIERRQVLKTAAATLFAPAFARAQGGPAPIRLAMVEALSGAFANTGEAVFRNLLWAVERVNQRGGVRLPGGARPLVLERYDSKGQAEEALAALRSAID